MKTHTIRSPHQRPMSSYAEAMKLFPSRYPERPVVSRPSENTVVDISRLQRIVTVEIRALVWKQGHRYFDVRVTHRPLRAISSLPATHSYELEPTFSAVRHLSTELHDRCEASAPRCSNCWALLNALAHNHSNTARLHLLINSQTSHLMKIQSFFMEILQHAVLSSAPNAANCGGCEWAVCLLASFLKEQYQPSTGII